MERTQSSAGSPVQNPFQPVLELLQGGDPEAVCARHGISRADLDERLQAYQASRRQLAVEDDLTVAKVGRNEPCPCGSGKKYKKCCLAKHEEARQNLSADQLQELEERVRLREKLEKEIQKGFELLMAQDFGKAQNHARRLLETFPEDDRIHDVAVNASLALGDYDAAFEASRRRWEVAQDEKEFYQENGYHKREGMDRKQMVHFYSPSTWLEPFWISQCARAHRERYPVQEDSRVAKMVEKLKGANDTHRFAGRQEDGYEMRRQALDPVLSELEAEGPAAIPRLLPLTYTFSWASLFVPDLLRSYGTDTSIRLLAELSMFRFPYFAQKCLSYLEEIGERAVPVIVEILKQDPIFDEIKVGLITVLGNIETPESFAILAELTQHENPYVFNWAAQALGRHKDPEALPYLEKAKERLAAISKIADAIRDLAGDQK